MATASIEQTKVARAAIEAKLHLGCAGWSIPRTAAEQFPPTGSHLARYAAGLSAVEINSSFYRPHRPATYARWTASVPEDFRFAVKMPKEITHQRRLCDVDRQLDGFLGECRHLGQKLGPVLVQLPPSLQFDAHNAVCFWRTLRDRFGGELVCEPRHPTWFYAAADELLREFRVARVVADPAVVPAAGVPGGSPHLAYFRLHGAPRVYYSSYDRPYLESLAEQLIAAAALATAVWCIFDNTALGAAVSNALELGELLREPQIVSS